MRFACTTTLLTVALFACSVFAEQPTSTQPQPDPLKGPAITDHFPPKGKGQTTFGPDSIETKKSKGARPTPPPSMAEFLKTFEVLRSNSTPEAARLTAEQDAKIKAAAADFDSATKAYMDKNKAELDALRSKLSPNDLNMLDRQLARGGQIHLSKAGFGGKKGVLKSKDKQPAASTDTSTTPTATGDDAAKTRTRLVEIYSGRPKVEDAESKILGLLSPEQLPLVDAELTKLDARHAPQHGVRGARGLKKHTPAAPKAD